MSEPAQHARGASASAISNGAVQLLHEFTGRGPTKARTTINRDTVMILLGDTLTKGEQKLTEMGDSAVVLQMRHRYQMAMRDDLISLVEDELDRKVVAFMSANHVAPDVAVEVFVLEPSPDGESDDHSTVTSSAPLEVND